jgi:dihydropteroate synthase
LHGSLASITAAVMKGAHIVRVHDVRATLESLKVLEAIAKT